MKNKLYWISCWISLISGMPFSILLGIVLVLLMGNARGEPQVMFIIESMYLYTLILGGVWSTSFFIFYRETFRYKDE